MNVACLFDQQSRNQRYSVHYHIIQIKQKKSSHLRRHFRFQILTDGQNDYKNYFLTVIYEMNHCSSSQILPLQLLNCAQRPQFALNKSSSPILEANLDLHLACCSIQTNFIKNNTFLHKCIAS